MKTIDFRMNYNEETVEVNIVTTEGLIPPDDTFALYIDGQNHLKVLQADYVLDTFHDFMPGCTSEMIGDTGYILIFDERDVISVGRASFLLGKVLIMKNGRGGLSGFDREELKDAYNAYRSRISRVKLGMMCADVYMIGQ